MSARGYRCRQDSSFGVRETCQRGRSHLADPPEIGERETIMVRRIGVTAHRDTSAPVLTRGSAAMLRSSRCAERVKFRQQHDAFQLVRIGARHNGDARFRLAHIVGQVRHIGRYVHELARTCDEMQLSIVVPPERQPQNRIAEKVYQRLTHGRWR